MEADGECERDVVHGMNERHGELKNVVSNRIKATGHLRIKAKK